MPTPRDPAGARRPAWAGAACRVAALAAGLAVGITLGLGGVAAADPVSGAPAPGTAPGSHPAPRPVPTAAPDQHRRIATEAAAAVRYATGRRVTSSVAVLDTTTGDLVTAGSTTGLYSAASVAKVFVAVDLLATGRLTGWKEPVARTMIERSDNDALRRLLPYVGYAAVYRRMVDRYHVRIGAQSSVSGWVGDTQLTSAGLARFYAAVKKDAKVWPWLFAAMSGAQHYAAGGVPQFFGIPAAQPVGGFAIKQGWFTDDYGGPSYSEGNSTGFVDHGRFAVVILTRGLTAMYGNDPETSYLGTTVTGEARRLMPQGRV